MGQRVLKVRNAPGSFPWLSLSPSSAKVDDCSTVNIAPTKLVIYVSPVFFFLFEKAALHCSVSGEKKKTQEEQYVSGPENANFRCYETKVQETDTVTTVIKRKSNLLLDLLREDFLK